MIPPIYLAALGLFGVATGLAWYFMLGAFAVSIGFSAVGILALARKRWLPAIVCTLLAIASVVLIYAYATVGSQI